MAHIVTIDDVQLALLASTEQQMRRSCRLVREQNRAARTEVEVLLIELVFIKRSKPVDDAESAAGWLEL